MHFTRLDAHAKAQALPRQSQHADVVLDGIPVYVFREHADLQNTKLQDHPGQVTNSRLTARRLISGSASHCSANLLCDIVCRRCLQPRHEASHM